MVADQASLLEGAQRLAPALVVVDVSFAEGRIEDMLQALHASAPGARVLVLSIYDERRIVAATLSAGADGFVLKRKIASDLLPAVDALLAGRRYVSPAAVFQSN
jgi:two-component system secretion response regulator SsrB